MNCSEKLAT